MRDRVRLGELLAGIGAVALTVLLAAADWFAYRVDADVAKVTGTLFDFDGGAWGLGWFAFSVSTLAALAGVMFLLRVLTASTTERVMLQAPVAFAVSLFALIVDAVRMLLFTPDESITLRGLPPTTNEGAVILGGWLGLLALALIAVGAWIAMGDERTETAGSKAQTEALLAESEPRVIPATPQTGESA